MCDHDKHYSVIKVIEEYKLDVDFICPEDGKTLMDFVIVRMKQIKPYLVPAAFPSYTNLF